MFGLSERSERARWDLADKDSPSLLFLSLHSSVRDFPSLPYGFLLYPQDGFATFGVLLS